MTASSRYVLRRPAVADAGAFADLHARVWRATYRDLMSQEALAEVTPEAFRPMWESVGAAYEEDRVPADGREFWVATTPEGVPAGFLMHGPPRDQHPPAPRQLWALNVDPAHHGTGLAQRLLDEKLGPGPVYLWVAAGNERAVSFYRRNGFEPDGVQDVEGRSGLVEVRMVRLAATT